MHQCLKFIYFGMTHYMFRMVFPSIIRSSKLYIQQKANVEQIVQISSGNEMELQLHLILVAVCANLNT